MRFFLMALPLFLLAACPAKMPEDCESGQVGCPLERMEPRIDSETNEEVVPIRFETKIDLDEAHTTINILENKSQSNFGTRITNCVLSSEAEIVRYDMPTSEILHINYRSGTKTFQRDAASEDRIFGKTWRWISHEENGTVIEMITFVSTKKMVLEKECRVPLD